MDEVLHGGLELPIGPAELFEEDACEAGIGLPGFHRGPIKSDMAPPGQIMYMARK